MKIGKSEFKIGERTFLMAIVNVTPDSFSDGGQYFDMDAAIARAAEVEREGADIIDVGGESTRPGYTTVSEQEEIDRILPVIKGIAAASNIPISADTYKVRVASAALNGGASMINDIWGFQKDPDMARVVADYGASVVLMHNRTDNNYGDLMSDILGGLSRSVDIALAAGIPQDKIIIDPGPGFAKDYEQNLELMRRLGELKVLGFPILLAASRKSFVLRAAGEPRLCGTVALTALGIAQGCDFVRVHDVTANKQACLMSDAVMRIPCKEKKQWTIRKNMDYIDIKNLELFAYHGVHESEKRNGQRFVISARLYFDAQKAGQSDTLGDTINYAEVVAGLKCVFCAQSNNLLEKCAEDAAMFVLNNFALVNAVRITVKKPDAPLIPKPEYASVTVERARHTAFIGMGSNIGDKRKYLLSALDALKEKAEVLAVSDFIITKPVGSIGQEDYINAAVKISTLLSPRGLLEFLLKIEAGNGRVRKEKWGARTLDLDILLFDGLVVSEDDLVIPHPLMHRRMFVLEPLAQIAPQAVHPLIGKRVAELKEDLERGL